MSEANNPFERPAADVPSVVETPDQDKKLQVSLLVASLTVLGFCGFCHVVLIPKFSKILLELGVALPMLTRWLIEGHLVIVFAVLGLLMSVMAIARIQFRWLVLLVWLVPVLWAGITILAFALPLSAVMNELQN